MITNAELLRRGMGWGPLETPPQPIPGGSHCALTGAPIDEGYPVMVIIPDSTGIWLDILYDVTGWLSEDAAICYSNDFRMGARLIFEDGTMYYPLVDCEAAAAQGRPCWSELVRNELPQRLGQRHIALLNTDYKKRVWPRTPVAVVGEAMRWYVYDAGRGVVGVQMLSLKRLLSVLDLVEEVARAGYPKPVIARNLYLKEKVAQEVGWAQHAAWERALQSLRDTPEFSVSIIIAQKGA